MEEKLREYAKLVIEVGLNIQKGQTLIISSPVECAHFARLCAGAAYDAGCREVIMNWSDDELARMKYLRAESSVFDDAPEWREKFFTHYAEMGGDPEGRRPGPAGAGPEIRLHPPEGL